MIVPKKILFVINPIAGGKEKKHLRRIIERELDRTFFRYEMIDTEGEDHARRLSRAAAGRGFDVVAAVGGDGTVNEAARGILEEKEEIRSGHRVALAIIPAGSGNGLARHLGIPMRAAAAIRLVNQLKTKYIDAGSMNGLPFFCVAGTGFDAYISRVFAKRDKRGFSGYIRSALREIRKYRAAVYEVETGEDTLRRNAFLISIANASQYGNNAYIAPAADISDGLLDVCILAPFPLYRYPEMAIRLMTGRIRGSRYMETFRSRGITIWRENGGPVHLDGEPRHMDRRLAISVLPSVIPVVVP